MLWQFQALLLSGGTAASRQMLLTALRRLSTHQDDYGQTKLLSGVPVRGRQTPLSPPTLTNYTLTTVTANIIAIWSHQLTSSGKRRLWVSETDRASYCEREH